MRWKTAPGGFLEPKAKPGGVPLTGTERDPKLHPRFPPLDKQLLGCKYFENLHAKKYRFAPDSGWFLVRHWNVPCCAKRCNKYIYIYIYIYIYTYTRWSKVTVWRETSNVDRQEPICLSNSINYNREQITSVGRGMASTATQTVLNVLRMTVNSAVSLISEAV